MKRLILGDPHGRWSPIKQIYDKEQPDEVVILGDYFDSFNIDAYTQRECYDNINQPDTEIDYKKILEHDQLRHKGRIDELNELIEFIERTEYNLI